MPVDRTLAADLTNTLVELYRDLETRLAADTARMLAADIERPDWADRKLSAVGKLRRNAERLVAQLEGDMGDQVAQAIVLAYVRGGQAALDEIARLQLTRLERLALNNQVESMARLARLAGKKAAAIARELAEIRDALPGVEAIQRLIFALVSLLRGTHLRILRWDLDAYRDVVARASVDVLAGTHTRLRAAQVAWEKLLAQGITGFVDKSGRRWQLTSYVEMATRTTVAQAAVQGHLDRIGAMGEDLVIVSDAPGECIRCRPWEGKVLSITGGGARTVEREHGINDNEMVPVHVAGSVVEAVAAGLMHPNCRHSLSLYLPGVTKIPTNTEDPQGDADRQRLRQLERHVRHWKRREVAAIDPDAKKRAAGKVRDWQAAIRDHVEETGLLRQRHREQLPVPPAAQPRPDATPTGPVPPQPDQPDGATSPAPPTGDVDLGAASDERLAELLGEHADDPDAFDQIVAEMDRRDAATAEPAEEADPLADVDLTDLLDNDLADLFGKHADRQDVVDRIEAEFARRDEFEARRQAAADAEAAAATAAPVEVFGDLGEHTEQSAQVDALIARGYDFREAYAEVHGLDPDQLDRQERAAALDFYRRPGETLDQAVRRLYSEHVHEQWLAAENATRGHLLSREGQRAGIDPVSLFSGPAVRARKYASEDLLRFWADNPRVTFVEFRAATLGRASDIEAAQRARLGGNARDFGV
jgi:hypothetical protein